MARIAQHNVQEMAAADIFELHRVAGVRFNTRRQRIEFQCFWKGCGIDFSWEPWGALEFPRLAARAIGNYRLQYLMENDMVSDCLREASGCSVSFGRVAYECNAG